MFKGLVTFFTVVLWASAGLAQSIVPNVEPSRVTGDAPLAVFFDGQKTACGSNCRAFHDLHFDWDFDDTQAGAWAITQRSKNKAYGPETAHVFERPGKYNVTLNISAKDGSTAVWRTKITVSDPDVTYLNKTVCFANTAGFSGCPSGAVQTITSVIDVISKACTAGKRCLLRRGDTFTGANGVDISGAGTYYDDFGVAANPPLMSRTGDAHGFHLNLASDTRIVDIQVKSTDAATHSVVHAEHKQTDLLVMRVSNAPEGGTYRGVVAEDSILAYYGKTDDNLHDGVFIVDSTFVKMGGNSVFLAARRVAMLGNNIDQQGNVHGTRIAHFDRLVVSDNKIANQGTGNAILTLRSAPASGGISSNPNCKWCGEATGAAVISDNIFRSVDDLTLDAVRINGPDQVIPTSHDMLIERNFFTIGDTAYDKGRQLATLLSKVDYVTVRNNVVYMENNQYYRALEGPGGVSSWAYGNSCYTPSADITGTQCVRYFTACWNNLLYAPKSTSKNVAQNCTVANNVIAASNPFTQTPEAGAALGQRLSSLAPTTIRGAGSLVPFNPVDFATIRRAPTPDIGAFEDTPVGPSTAPGRPTLIEVTQ